MPRPEHTPFRDHEAVLSVAHANAEPRDLHERFPEFAHLSIGERQDAIAYARADDIPPLLAAVIADDERKEAARIAREEAAEAASLADEERNRWQRTRDDWRTTPAEAALILGKPLADLEAEVTAGACPFPVKGGGFYLKPLECWEQAGFLLGEFARQAAEQNSCRRFLAERCRPRPGGQAAPAALHRAYVLWREGDPANVGERERSDPLTVQEFHARMTEIGMEQGRDAKARYWVGVEMLPEDGTLDDAATFGGEAGALPFGSPLAVGATLSAGS